MDVAITTMTYSCGSIKAAGALSSLSLQKWTKRGFRATYGPVARAADIENRWVTCLDNKRYDLKSIKPVRVG